MLAALTVLTLLAAQPTTGPSQGGEVDKLISRGIELREQGKDAEALDIFRRAYELSQGGRALAQLALAEQALGRWVEAETHLRAALDTKQDKWIAANRQALEGAMQTIQQRLGSLEVVCSLPGAEVKVAGRLVGRCPLSEPARVVAGSVALEVTSEGYWPVSRSLLVPTGGVLREVVELAPKPVAERPAPPNAPTPVVVGVAPKPAVPPPDRGLPPLFWVGTGAAAVGTGFAIGGFAAAFSAVSDFDARPDCDPNAPLPSCPNYNTPTAVGWVGLIVGGLGAGLAVWALVSDGPDASVAQVQLNGGPGGRGLGVDVRF